MAKLQDGAKGIKWISFSRLLRQGIQFLTLLILARLLEPKDFGLMGIALIVLNFLNTIRDFGLGSALIQKTEVNSNLIASAFYLNIGASILLTVTTILLAPSLASLLSNEQESFPIIIKIIRILALVFLITSVALVQQSMLEKSLKFKNIAIYETLATFIGAVASIIIALNGGGVGSLVSQCL